MQHSAAGAVPRNGGLRAPLIAPAAAAAVASMLAHGAILGEIGVAHLKRYDEEKGITRRIKVTLDSIDARYRIVSNVRAGVGVAAAQAQAINAEYKVTETVELGVARALNQAAVLAARAMENPTVASFVTSGQAFVRQALKAAEHIAEQTREEVARAHANQPQLRGYVVATADGTPALPPAAQAAPQPLPVAAPPTTAATTQMPVSVI